MKCSAPKSDEEVDGLQMASVRIENASNRNRESLTSSPKAHSRQQTEFDYVNALDNIKTAIRIGGIKAHSTSISLTSTLRMVLKAMMSGCYLGFAITLTTYAISLGWDKVSAALLFPMGFVLLILMGNDLATGNFALLPMAYWNQRQNEKKISIKMILQNWLVVYGGNFIGCLLYLFILWGGYTHFGARDKTKYADFKLALCTATTSKTLGYSDNGSAGWFAALFNGILCNWMVTMGVLLSFSSKSTIGKIFAMYIPITLFITLGFEHSIVNLFLLPAGLAFKCNTYTFAEWWLWNQIPVTIGNMFGGIVLTGMVYRTIWAEKL